MGVSDRGGTLTLRMSVHADTRESLVHAHGARLGCLRPSRLWGVVSTTGVGVMRAGATRAGERRGMEGERTRIPKRDTVGRPNHQLSASVGWPLPMGKYAGSGNETHWETSPQM